MDLRAEKIAKARQKLKDHQEKKINAVKKEEDINKLTLQNQEPHNDNDSVSTAKNVLNALKNNLDDQTESLKEKVISNNESTNKKIDVNVTEILISTKMDLEMQINKLNEKLTNLESLYEFESINHDKAKQNILGLEHNLNTLKNKYSTILHEISDKDKSLTELKDLIINIKDENNNLTEQLEFTKSMLTTKESENAQLQNEIWSYQNQLDVFQLQIQQLTNNCSLHPEQNNKTSEQADKLIKKISNLEQTIEALQKERDQINSHYEHYVRDLNEQIRSEMFKNEEHVKKIQNLYNRENSLIEHISEMEIRLQNYNFRKEEKANKEETYRYKEYQDIQAQLLETNTKYMELQKQYMNSLARIEELNQVNETEYNHANLSIDKLNADITSDKIAAQRATEQNKKLKSDVIELEKVIIKLGQDKLELTEMWTHEKQLNRGLALKLAEVEESLRNMLKQLKAKDEEMIRLQNENRELQQEHKSVLEQPSLTQENENMENNSVETIYHHNNTSLEQIPLVSSHSKCFVEVKSSIANFDISNDNIIAKEDAMTKLQERFLNIMDQVANLSDEKHRLEHIILQLQNETDTICEYVALYQQQRNLLKKREEERNNQLKIYEVECDKLKQHLEELHDLLLRFAADPELESFFKEERRRHDLARVRELLEQLQNCSLTNPKFKNLDLNIFYPCRCCSGKVIDV